MNRLFAERKRFPVTEQVLRRVISPEFWVIFPKFADDITSIVFFGNLNRLIFNSSPLALNLRLIFFSLTTKKGFRK